MRDVHVDRKGGVTRDEEEEEGVMRAEWKVVDNTGAEGGDMAPGRCRVREIYR